MAALQAELKIVSAGTGGVSGGGVSSGGLANNKELADSLKDMARFFRRPQQVLGDINSGGLNLMGGAIQAGLGYLAGAAGVSLAGVAVTLLGSAAISAATAALAKKVGEELAEQTGAGQDLTGTEEGQQAIRDLATDDPNKGSGTIPFTGDPNNPIPVDIKEVSYELPDEVSKEIAKTTGETVSLSRDKTIGFLPVESFKLNQDVEKVQEEINKLTKDNIDDREQLTQFEDLALKLAEQKKFAEEEMLENQRKGFRVSQEQYDTVNSSTVLLGFIGSIIDDNTSAVYRQLVAELSVNDTLVERIRLRRQLDSIENRSKKKIISSGRGALTGSVYTISSSSFGLEGAGSNRDLLARYGSPEAITASGR